MKRNGSIQLKEQIECCFLLASIAHKYWEALQLRAGESDSVALKNSVTFELLVRQFGSRLKLFIFQFFITAFSKWRQLANCPTTE